MHLSCQAYTALPCTACAAAAGVGLADHTLVASAGRTRAAALSSQNRQAGQEALLASLYTSNSIADVQEQAWMCAAADLRQGAALASKQLPFPAVLACRVVPRRPAGTRVVTPCLLARGLYMLWLPHLALCSILHLVPSYSAVQWAGPGQAAIPCQIGHVVPAVGQYMCSSLTHMCSSLTAHLHGSV